MGQAARSHRYPLHFTAAYDDGDVYQTGPVRDLSTTGCFIETDKPLPRGRTVRVMPINTDESDELCELVGQVSRVEAGGMGVRFSPLSDQALIRVIKFCESRSPAATPVPKKKTEIPESIVPKGKSQKLELVEDENIMPLEVEDDHDSMLRHSLHSIEGEPVVEDENDTIIDQAAPDLEALEDTPEETGPAMLDDLNSPEFYAFGKKSWGWAALFLVGGALVGAAYLAQDLIAERALDAEGEGAVERALIGVGLERAHELKAASAELAAVVAKTPAPYLEVKLTSAPVPSTKELAVHVETQLINPGHEDAVVSSRQVEVFLGSLEASKAGVRTLNAPGTEGPVRWARVHQDKANAKDVAAGDREIQSIDLAMSPGKATLVGVRVETMVGEATLTRTKIGAL